MLSKMAKAAVHRAFENMMTPEKIAAVEEVIVRRIAEGKLVETTVHTMLMTMRAGMLEMTSKETLEDKP